MQCNILHIAIKFNTRHLKTGRQEEEKRETTTKVKQKKNK